MPNLWVHKAEPAAARFPEEIRAEAVWGKRDGGERCIQVPGEEYIETPLAIFPKDMVMER